MFPLRDDIRSRTFPVVTALIILANALVFFLELSLSPPRLQALINDYGLMRASIDFTNPFTWFPFLSHQFLHGGWIHFIGNMWFLFIFGDNVEDRIGSIRFLVFYLLGGASAGAVEILFSSSPQAVAIGASGAIAAVLGAYIVFFPRARVVTFIPVFFLPWIINVPAVLYLGMWFVIQFFQGLLAFNVPAAAGGVAWWAHIGGFIFGLVLAYPFAIGRRALPYHSRDILP
jgi:membrane associated rhomboid family serine protease